MVSEQPAFAVADPESDPRATYALEPEEVASLTARLVTSREGGSTTTTAPATGAPLASVPLATADDVHRAAAQARLAQRAWAATPVRERAKVLLRFGDLLLDGQSDVLDLIQLESGKARLHAFEEVYDLASIARHLGVRGPGYLATRREAGMVPGLTSVRVHHRPAGLVGVITPWNYPLNLPIGDSIAALLAGNAVLLKPDTQTVLSALWGAEQLEAAGLPAGVLQVVAGDGAVGAAVVDAVDHVAFTGSTATGRVVAAAAARNLTSSTLELGGKNALYVAEDVDVETAAEGAVRACFAGAGQVCVSVERIYVHHAVADEFTLAFVRRIKALRLGGGLDYTNDVGSITTQAQLEKIVTHFDDAVAKGARVLVGGVHRTDLGPLFFEPTVLADVSTDAECAREETFGPLVALYRVGSDDEAVAAINDSDMGLNVSLWTASERRGRAIADRVRAGIVNINEGYAAAWSAYGAPVGGWGASGLGARHGREGVLATTLTQTVAAQRLAHRGLGLRRFYELPGEQTATIFTGVLRALRAARMP
ncbi:MAG: aldehyde dehydrogenase family protein [Actinomycetales bacterium]|nr:aldehyde dehydrogenase family protein [Actinomycetales bacterium]